MADVGRFELMIMRERTIGLCLLPLIIAAFIPIAHELVWKTSFVPHIRNYSIRVAIGAVAGIAASIWLYRQYYFDNIQVIKGNLEDLDSLAREGKV